MWVLQSIDEVSESLRLVAEHADIEEASVWVAASTLSVPRTDVASAADREKLVSDLPWYFVRPNAPERAIPPNR